jgi:hypothetical protein
MATARAWSVPMVTVIKSSLRFWKVFDIDNPLGGVWHVFTRSKHRSSPREKVRIGSIKGTICPVYTELRSLATVS